MRNRPRPSPVREVVVTPHALGGELRSVLDASIDAGIRKASKSRHSKS